LDLVFGVKVRVVSVDAVVLQVRVGGGIALQVYVVHVELQPGLKVVAKTLVNDFKNLFCSSNKWDEMTFNFKVSFQISQYIR
jgi:hypothetical protein